MRKNTKEKFLTKILKTEHCWLWQGSRFSDGMRYGQFRFNGKNWKTHRFSYAIHIGSIPCGMSVLHTCDNPICVNPAHLYLGNHNQNMKDMAERGRRRSDKGECNPMAKLTTCEVRDILTSNLFGVRQRILSAQYSVTEGTISGIVSRRDWKHV